MSRTGPGRDDLTMTTQAPSRPRWRVPAALIALSAVPVLGGAFRVAQLSGAAAATPDSARFFAAPVPVLLHIAGATVYCVLGAFQFAPGLRRSPWHRRAGRVLVLCGLVAALSGLWMALFYPLPAHDDSLLTALRLVFGSAMAVAIALGLAAIRRRDVRAHRAWMIRGYAIAQGAGSQAVIIAAWVVAAGEPSGRARALLLGAGWVVNVVIAEWIIRREGTR